MEGKYRKIRPPWCRGYGNARRELVTTAGHYQGRGRLGSRLPFSIADMGPDRHIVIHSLSIDKLSRGRLG